MSFSSDIKPVSFSFSNTQRCQSRCITCGAWETPGSVMENELSTQEWKDIIKKVRDWVGEYSFIFSGGEPFLREDLFEIAEYATSIGVTVDVISNGLALRDRSEDLINSAFRTIIFSLNSIENPQYHIESRGRKDSFKITVDALQNLIHLNRKTGYKKGISISTVVMPSNLSEIKPMAEFAKAEGIGVCFQLLDNGDAFVRPPDDSLADASFNASDKAIEAVDLMIELKNQGYPVYNGYPQLEAFKILIDRPEEIPNIQCRVGDNNFSIDAYGDVRICFCMDAVGSLRENTPEEIWLSEKANQIREKINNCTRKCRLLNCNFKD